MARSQSIDLAVTSTGAGPRARRSLVVAAVVLTLTALATAIPLAPRASGGHGRPETISVVSASSTESQFFNSLNDTRRAHGLAPLVLNDALSNSSRSWSATMQSRGALSHDPDLAAKVAAIVPNWSRAGENVGVGYSVSSLHQAFYDSDAHRQNMLGAYNQVGIGATTSSDGRIWVTFRFAQGSLPAAPAPTSGGGDRLGVRRANEIYLRSTLSSGPATLAYGYGTSTDVAVMGDWDGNGTDTPGVFRDGIWYLRNSNSGGAATIAVSFGAAGDQPIVGDWNDDGRDTVGVWRAGYFYLRNSNTNGYPHIGFKYGTASDTPLVGDWNGNGSDSPGIRRGNAWYLRNYNSGGGAHLAFGYGTSTDSPVIGDWDGNGTDTPGIRRGNAFYLRNSNSSGGAHLAFGYGTTTDIPVVGDWNG